MTGFFSAYFYYSRRERNGALVLVAATLTFLVAPLFFPFLTDEKIPKPDPAAFPAEKIAANISYPETDTLLPANIPFDPNEADYGTLTDAGLSPKVAATLIHYREKGGHFYKKEDLRKVYGLKAEDYARLEENILIGTSESGGGERKFKSGYTGGNYFATFKDSVKAARAALEIRRPPKYTAFDPNTATEEELLNLGLMLKSVKVLENYRNKGGRFFKAADLQRIYGLPDSDFVKLEPFIQIPTNQNFKQLLNTKSTAGTPYTPKADAGFTVDVNNSTEDDWLRLKGIGRTFASSITHRREILGGFASIDQIREVYGLPDSTFVRIKIQLKLISPIFRKLHINKADSKILSHPYLTVKQAEVLMRYRVNHGDFKTPDDLKAAHCIDDVMLEKLKPYLSFEGNN